MGKKSRKKQQVEKIKESELIQRPVKDVQKNGFQKPALFPYLILFLLAVLVYSSSFHLKYAVDDTIVLTENQFTQKGFKGLKKIFTSDAFEGFFGERGAKLVAGGRYRPLSIATLAIEYEFFGMNPVISHSINVLLYALSGLLMYSILLMLFPVNKSTVFYLSIPFLTTLLYITHPIHTEAVANIKGRDEIMVFLFSLVTLWGCVKFVNTRNVTALLLGFISFGLAFLSKENGITFLAVIPLTLYFFTNAKIKDYIITTVPLILITAIYLYVRSLYTESSVTDASSEILNNPFVNASLGDRYATVLKTFVHYLRLLIFPHPLSHDYYFNQVPVTGWSNPITILSIILNAGLLYYVIKNFRKKDPLAFAILFFYITFSVVSNFFFTVGVAMSERFIYISSFGFCLALAILLKRLYSYLKSRNLAQSKQVYIGILAIFIIGYSIKTFTRNFNWYNNFTLFTHDVHISKNSAKLQTAAGGELVAFSDKKEYKDQREDMLQRAITHLKRAIEIYPQHSNAWLLLGNATYKLTNSPDEAVAIYKKAMSYRKGYFDAIYNIGCVLSDNKQHAAALPYFKRAVKLKPRQMEALHNLAATYLEVNKIDSGIIYFKKQIELNPQRENAYFQLGNIYGRRLGDIDNAIIYFKKALELNPKNESYLENLGVCYGFKQQYRNALDVFNQILLINPENANAYFNLSITEKNMGNEQKSDVYLKKAIELDPSFAKYAPVTGP